uniref:WRKY domain-containing protein n=1 Tax=Triticum urartu TaxID=4572 RepID=A0A8R7TAY0_TRIUA
MKKVVREVPVAEGGVNGPDDQWAWRKYGQKPIKGSPYPRRMQRILQVQQHEGVHGAEAGGAQPGQPRRAPRHLHRRPLPRRAHHHKRARWHHAPPAPVASVRR